MKHAEKPLRIGERGYYREFADTWPARVLANDVIQTFGPIDCIIAVTKWPGHECTTRLVRRRNCVTNGRWVSCEEFEAEERGAIAREGLDLLMRAERLVHG